MSAASERANGTKPGPGALEAITGLRMQLWSEGFRPVPAYSHNHPDRERAGKAPLGAAWTERARRDPPEAAAMPAVLHALNTGILCDGLCAVDIDVDDPELAGCVRALAIEMLGETIIRCRENSGRCLLPYRAAEGSPRKRHLAGNLGKVEVLGHGQQFVSHGTHKSGAELYWSPEPPEEFGRDALPAISEEQVTAFLRAVAPLIEADPAKAEDPAHAPERGRRPCDGTDRAETLDVIAALAVIPNDGEADWEHWNNVGMAAWAASGGSEHAFATWCAWSARHPEHDEAACRARWTHYPTSPPTQTGAGKLYKLAHDTIPGWRRPSETREEARRRAPEPPPWGEVPPWAEADQHNAPTGGKAKEQTTGAHGDPHEDKWHEPVDFLADDTHGTPLLEPRHVPAVIWRFAADTAARMGVDTAAVALSALVCCAAACSDEWAVQPKRYDYTWTENPRLWGAIVGSPSILKTPIIAACTRPIDRLEMEARKEHAEKMRQWRAEEAAAKADKTPPPPRPRCDRFMVEGATVEALSEVLRDDEEARFRVPCRKILSWRDEMSEFFGGLDRYRAGGKGGSDRGAYLRLYNGGRYTVDRIGRGSFAVPDWSACFLGGIQPEPIQRVARETADDGLLQRFLYCVPDKQKPGVDQKPDHSAVAGYEALFPALVAMRPAAGGENGRTQPVVFHSDAHKHREDIDALVVALAAMPDASPRLKASLGKWPGLFARLSLTFHLIEAADQRVRGDSLAFAPVISESVAERVATYMRQVVLPHLLRAENIMFSTAQTGHARWIAGLILSRGMSRVTTRDVTRAYGALRPPEAAQELMAVMESLVAVGWLEPEPPTNPAKGVTGWKVNPRVHTQFAASARAEAERRREAREHLAEVFAKLRAEAE